MHSFIIHTMLCCSFASSAVNFVTLLCAESDNVHQLICHLCCLLLPPDIVKVVCWVYKYEYFTHAVSVILITKIESNNGITQCQLIDVIMELTVFTQLLPSVHWRCWLGGRKGIRPVKTEWWDVGVVVWDEVHWCRLASSPADATATHYLLLQ